MKKTSTTNRLLSLVLCICMVLSLLPGIPLAASAASEAPLVYAGHIEANGNDLILEAGEKEGYTKIRYGDSYVYFRSTYDTGATAYEADLSRVRIYGQGNLITVNGGTVDAVYGGGNGKNVNGDTNIVINGGTVEQIYGGTSGSGNKPASVTGNVNVTINGGTVSTVTTAGRYTKVSGNTYVTVNGGSVKRIQSGAGEISVGGDCFVNITGGTVNSVRNGGDTNVVIEKLYLTYTGGKINILNIDVMTDTSTITDNDRLVLLLYAPVEMYTKYNAGLITDLTEHWLQVEGSAWKLKKGTIDGATQGKDFVIQQGQTFTVSSDLTCQSKIVNYGTVTVKNGGVLNHVDNYGTVILEDGSAVTRVDNHGTLNSTGVLKVGNLENDGTVNFTGTAHITTVVNNRTNNAKFYCHGDHDGMNVIQESGWFYCDNPDCETVFSGRYYGVVPLEWSGYYVNVTNEKGVPCYTQEYSCTLVPQWTGMLLPETITVHEFRSFTQTLVEGEHYSWDRTTGEFRLFQGVVSFYPIAVTVSAYYPTDISAAEVTLDQDRFLWDGNAKEPKVLSVQYGDQVLTEGTDYRFVEYQHNVDPGTAYVVLEGLGEYSGTVRVPFEIYQKELTQAYQITLEEGDWKFINGEIKPKVSVTVNTESQGIVTLEEGKDYTVSYENNIKPGIATVTVTGMGQYKGTLTDTFYIDRVNIGEAIVTGNVAPYNGQKQDLNIQVTYNGMTLVENVDYVVRFTSSVSVQLQYAGDSAEVSIQGIGDCFTNTKKFQWSIVDGELSDYTFVGVDRNGGRELYYTGFPQTPSSDWHVVVEDEAGEQFYLFGSWTPVTNVGDVSTFTASSGTNFNGTLEVPGIIQPMNLSDYEIYAFDSTQGRTYTGQSQQLGLKVYMVSDEGETYYLQEGVDYTLSGTTEATEPGTYTVTMEPAGKNFTGSRTVTWEIDPVDISGLQITEGAAPSFTYSAELQTPDTKVYYTFADGTRVEIPGSWSSVTNVGDDTTFTAASEYFTGSVTLKDVVKPLDISGQTVTLEKISDVYDGDEHWSSPRLEGYEEFYHTYDYEVTWDRDPVDVGTYTATVTGIGNFTGAVTLTYEITPKPLTVIIRLDDKTYDGTTDVEVLDVVLEGAVMDDVLEADHTQLVIDLPSTDAGTYPTADISGLTLSGEDLKNYSYDLNTAALQLIYGATFFIDRYDVDIVAEEQDVIAGEELDQTRWYVDGVLPEGYTLTDVVLTANDSTGEVAPSGGVVTDAAGNDVTENFRLNYYSSKLTLVCTNHVCDEYGFCASCGGYQMPETDPGEDPEWTYDDIYLVYNPGQLFWVADYVNKVSNEINVKLMADITVPEGRQWIPFLNFYGTFDGNFKTVSGLNVKSESGNVGFFGGGGYAYGTIKNLHLSNSSFEGDYAIGGIAGYHAGTIENCFVDDTVTVKGNNDVGALVGDFGGYMFNCYAYATVPVGYSYYGYLENCYCLSETETQEGGMTAAQFASGEVAYLLQSAIVGEEIYDEDWNWIGTAEPRHIWGQTIGEDAYPTLGGQKVYKNQIGGCCEENFIYEYSNTEAEPVYTHRYDNGFCVCGDYESAVLNRDIYEIGNGGQLYWFAAQVNSGKTDINGKLTADITVNEDVLNEDGSLNGDGDGFHPWTPIGNYSIQYTGTFDGGNYTVSGLYFNDSNVSLVGLFGYVCAGGTVKNVGVKASYFSGMQQVGGVVGLNFGIVVNCYNTGTITGRTDVGGVLGKTSKTAQNCYNTGTVIGSSSCVGGVAGFNSGTIENCYNTGNVSGSSYSYDIGGVVGFNGSTVAKCYNTASVEGGTNVGGIVGRNGQDAVENCYNTGDVKGVSYVGGVMGKNEDGLLRNCYNTGSVAGDSEVGGVVYAGLPERVINCYYLHTDKNMTDASIPATAEEFEAGIVAFWLQDEQTEQVWGQNIDNGLENEGHPVFSDARVRYGHVGCAVDTQQVYTNKVVYEEKPAPSFDVATGICDHCQYQPTALVIIGETVTGYDQLRNAIAAVANCTAEDKAVVKLFASVDVGYQALTIASGVFTLDLNGNQLIGQSLQDNALRIQGGDVTITSSVPGGEIKINHGTGSLEGVTNVVSIRGKDTKVTMRDLKVTLTSENTKVSFCIIQEQGHLILDGVTVDSQTVGICTGMSSLEVIGGSIVGSVTDLMAFESTVVLRDGVSFPEGIRTMNALYSQFGVDPVPLNKMLGAGMAFWQDGVMTELPDDAVAFQGGSVTVKAVCTHENSTISFIPLANGTHHGIAYSCCGMVLEAAPHQYGADGLCTQCSAECPHIAHDNDCICFACGKTVEHQYDESGVCLLCEAYKLPVLNGDTYEIYTAEHLYWFAEQVNSGNSAINGRLMNNIVVNEGTMSAASADARVWIPIGAYGSMDTMYVGTFDGQGYAVSGLYFNDSSAVCVGLFGVVYGGSVKNVGVINSWICGKESVGGVAGGVIYGSISTCYNAGDVSGERDVGGVAGTMMNVTVTNCYNTGHISGDRYVGGIIGYNEHREGVVLNSYNIGSITCEGTCSPVVGYGGGCINSYYLDTCGTTGLGNEMTAEQFASGEVAYLLSQGCTYNGDPYVEDSESDENSEFYPGDIWGQNIDNGKPVQRFPVLGGAKVYNVTDCKGEQIYSNVDTNGHHWTDATCTEPKICDRCCETEGEALGHGFENGSCTVCGEPDPDYMPPVDQPTITLMYPTLSFKDEVLLNVYFDVSNMEDVVEMGLLCYDTQTDSWTISNAKQVISGYERNQFTGLYKVSTKGIPAKNMGDTVWFSVYAKLSDGSYCYSKLADYSPERYAYSQLGVYGAELDALLVAMLNYGAAAQLYFNYNTDDLINQDLTAEQQALAETYRKDMMPQIEKVEAAKQGSFVDNGGFTDKNLSVSFKDAFMINYYCTPVSQPVDGITMYYWKQADFLAADVLTAQNATGAVEMTLTDNGAYKASVTGISAKNMADGVYVAFVYSDGTTTYSSNVLQYSVGSYCNAMANDPAVAQLAQATAVYGYSAKQYFLK